MQDNSSKSTEKKTNSILKVPKNGMGSFTFLAASGPKNEGSYFYNDFVGFPSVPFLGQYSKMGYEINDVKMLSIHECEADESSQTIRFSATSEEIVLPAGLKKLILDIPEEIPNNKPVLYDDDEYAMNPGLQENIEYYESFHEFPFPKTSSFNFAWSVSFQDSNVNTDLSPMPMNIVIHPFVYPVIDLLGKKRICSEVPVCVFPAELDPGMKPWTQDFRSVNFGSFRSEFLAVHMRGPALCFSPNNLKFELDPEADISHFYSFVLVEDGFYIVSYHWNINNPALFKPLQQIFEKSNDTKEIIENIEEFFGSESAYVKTLHSIFKNTNQKLSKHACTQMECC